MKLDDALKLQPGDIITCSATGCGCIPNAEVEISTRLAGCDCRLFYHTGNEDPFLVNAKFCRGNHKSRWIDVSGQDITFIEKRRRPQRVKLTHVQVPAKNEQVFE